MKKFIALVAFGFAGIALAQALPSFDQVDANHDGVISKDEASKIEGLDFATCDKNQDGNLSREEYDACAGQAGKQEENNSGDKSDND